jgi:Fungal chitosanase of glycosyl hydrolase group 75
MNIDNFKPAETFRGTRIYRQANNLAYAYVTSYKAVDADGAPNAYHPDDIGLDLLANAGYPHSSWWKDVLVPDPSRPSKAYAQVSGEYEGYFVAMTSLRDPNGIHTDPATYIDATRFPYVVIPTGFESLPNVAKPGDVGFATHLPTGVTSTFIVGDSGGGSAAKLGEGSIALFVALGGQDPNPRNGSGVPSGKIQYIIFPGSRKQGAGIWPRTSHDIHDQAMDLISNTPDIG